MCGGVRGEGLRQTLEGCETMPSSANPLQCTVPMQVTGMSLRMWGLYISVWAISLTVGTSHVCTCSHIMPGKIAECKAAL